MTQISNNFDRFWKELRRRKVIRVIPVYAVAAFVILQVASMIIEPLHLPGWTMPLLIILISAGFILTVILAWAYDITSQGIDKTKPIEKIAEPKVDHVTVGNSALKEKSIIVLPFENISPDPDQEYFSDGLTEEIITDLSHIRDLLVISRSSAMTFKRTKKKIGEIAADVNVRYVLEGSVRKAGNDLRITAQLIDAVTDTHLWAEKYAGVLDNIFDIQEKVSRAVVNGLKIQLNPEEAGKITERPITDLKAYECYLRATSALDSGAEDDVKEAIRNLELALEIIGENVLLYYGMGYAYRLFVNQGIKMDENLSKCKEYANKALKIDSGSTKPLALLGFANIFYNSDWKQVKEASLQLKRVLEKDPNESLALLALALIYIGSGKISEATLLSRSYIEREPLSGWSFALPVYIKWFNGQYESSLNDISRWLKNFPNPGIEAHCAWGLAWSGRYDEAINIIDKSAKAVPDHVHIKLGLMLKYGLQSNIEKMRSEINSEFHDWCYRECWWSYFLAGALALANAKNDALEWLEHAVDLGWVNYPILAEKDPFLTNIRSEAQFKKLMVRVKYEWENFEV